MPYDQFLEADELPGGRLDLAAETCERWFAALDEVEVEFVLRVVASAGTFHLLPLARAATRLGNGWIYPILALGIVAAGSLEAPARFLAAVAASVSLSFLGYPGLKRLLARTRPCDYEPSLVQDEAPLDRYSCPSGHSMMAASFGVTLLFESPGMVAVALPLILIIGWSRIAMGHHYVSDVVAGAMMGGVVAAAVALLM